MSKYQNTRTGETLTSSEYLSLPYSERYKYRTVEDSEDVATSAIIGAVTDNAILGGVLGGSLLGGIVGDILSDGELF